MKIAIAMLVLLVGVLAYFAYTSAPHNDWKGCPSVMHRVQHPPPPTSPEELQYKVQIDGAIAQINERLPLVTDIQTASVATEDYHDSRILYRALARHGYEVK